MPSLAPEPVYTTVLYTSMCSSASCMGLNEASEHPRDSQLTTVTTFRARAETRLPHTAFLKKTEIQSRVFLN